MNAVTIKIGDSSAAFDEKIGYISGFKATNMGMSAVPGSNWASANREGFTV